MTVVMFDKSKGASPRVPHRQRPRQPTFLWSPGAMRARDNHQFVPDFRTETSNDRSRS